MAEFRVASTTGPMTDHVNPLDARASRTQTESHGGDADADRIRAPASGACPRIWSTRRRSSDGLPRRMVREDEAGELCACVRSAAARLSIAAAQTRPSMERRIGGGQRCVYCTRARPPSGPALHLVAFLRGRAVKFERMAALFTTE